MYYFSSFNGSLRPESANYITPSILLVVQTARCSLICPLIRSPVCLMSCKPHGKRESKNEGQCGPFRPKTLRGILGRAPQDVVEHDNSTGKQEEKSSESNI